MHVHEYDEHKSTKHKRCIDVMTMIEIKEIRKRKKQNAENFFKKMKKKKEKKIFRMSKEIKLM